MPTTRVSTLLCRVILLAMPQAPAVAGAHFFTVTSSVDGAPGSLRAAIEGINAHPDVDPGSQFVIAFATSEAVIAQTDALPPIEKARVRVEGPGATELALSGQGEHVLFQLAPHVVEFELVAITLMDGFSDDSDVSGCVTSNDPATTVRIVDAALLHCRGRTGGAALIRGPLQIERSSFIGNHVAPMLGARGGAIAIAAGAGLTEIRQSTFQQNTIPITSMFILGHGAAISTLADTTLVIVDSSFIDNGMTQISAGGAVHGEGSAVHIASSHFAGNRAVAGLAIAVGGANASLRLTNSSFVGNLGAGSGVVRVVDAAFHGRNNTFWNNTPSGPATSDIAATNPHTFVLSHHVHAGRISGEGPLCDLQGLPLDATIAHSYALDDSCQMTVVSDLHVDGVVVADNGNPVVQLAIASAAVDGGAETADAHDDDPSACEPYDAQGFRRPVAAVSGEAAICDAGAFEFRSGPMVFVDGFES